MSRPTPLTDEVTWLSECHPLPDGRHLHVSVYLIRGAEGNLVVDTGSFHHRESLGRSLSAATGDQGIQALLLSHSDFPHSSNIGAFREAWGDFEIVASCGDAGIQGLPYARRSRIGGSLEVCGRTFDFVDPPLADRSHTSWIYDRTSRVMFTADGFGNHHDPGECALTWSGIPEGLRAEDIHAFHAEAHLWLRYVEPALLARTLREMFERHPVSWVAPVHGNPVPGDEVGAYIDLLEESAARVAGSWTVPYPSSSASTRATSSAPPSTSSPNAR